MSGVLQEFREIPACLGHFLLGRCDYLKYFEVMARFHLGDLETAARIAEEVAADEEADGPWRQRMLLQLTIIYAKLGRPEDALDAYSRLEECVCTTDYECQIKQACLRRAAGFLKRAGILDPSATVPEEGTVGSSSTAGETGPCCSE